MTNDEDGRDLSTMPTAPQRVVRLANAIIHGKLGVIEGSRRLCQIRAEHPSLRDDEGFGLFVAIESETDHLPAGEVRTLWAPDVLIVEDREIRALKTSIASL